MQSFSVCTSRCIRAASESCRALRTLGNAPQGRGMGGRKGGKEWAGGRLGSLDRVKYTLLPNSPYCCHGLPSSQGATPTPGLWLFLVCLFGGVCIGRKSLKKSCLKGIGRGELADGPLKRKPQSWRERAMEASYEEGLRVSCIMSLIPVTGACSYN